MNWFTETFAEQSIGWLLISTVVALISGLLSSLLTYRLKRQEITDTALADIQKRRHELALEAENSREERIRQEVIRWANPILGTVKDLESRLRNILYNKGYQVLSEESQKQIDLNWSISYDYFMYSTLYLFGQYFAWVQMLQEELNFELFQSQQEKDKFFEAVEKVSSSLGSFPPNYRCSGKDTQLFRLQQRAIGELLILRENDQRKCLSYPEFLLKLSDHNFNQHLKPLRSLLEDVDPQDDCRWKRLEATQQALIELKSRCEELLDLTTPSI